MKKILKKSPLSNRDGFPMTGSHIQLLRILEITNDGIFTEDETAHFDVCRVCRLKVIDSLRNLAPLVPAVCGSTMRKAA
jgi:hypothetical protein